MILNRLTIRARITIGTFLLAGLFFAGTALVVQRSVESILDTATATLLETDAAPYVAEIVGEPGTTLDSPAEDQLVAVTDATGTLVQSSLPETLTDRALALAAAAATIAADVTPSATPRPTVDSRTATINTVEVNDAIYIVRVEPVATPDGVWTVISARNDAASDLIVDRLTGGLLIGLVVLTLIFGGASWLLTGAALRPVGTLRRSAESLLDTEGTDLLAVGSARDEITDLAVTLNSLIRSLREATERERQMVSDASHELRTPVAILQAQLELIRTGDRSTLDADLASAERATHRLADLVSTLLVLSRLEAAPEHGSSTFAELAEELGDSVDRARYAARSLDVTVDFSIESRESAATVPIPAHGFARIVDNLVQNAVVASGDVGDVTVTLSDRHRDGDRGRYGDRDRDGDGEIVLTVVDSGPGMPPEFMSRAFDRFSRASESRGDGGKVGTSASTSTTGASPSTTGTSTSTTGAGAGAGHDRGLIRHGTGLGLAIVQVLVTSAGGTIRLENVEGAGLLVTVRLPCRESTEPGAPRSPDR